MNPVKKVLQSFESKSKHDLIKVILGAAVGFVVERLVENSYDKAVKNRHVVIHTTSTES